MLKEVGIQTNTTDACLEQTQKTLQDLSKDFDIKDYPVDAPQKKKDYIVSTMKHDPFRIFVGKEYGIYTTASKVWN